MIILEAVLFMVVSVGAPLLWLMYFSDLSFAKHNAKMEEMNVDHARDMQKLHDMSAHLFASGERDFVITYIVPTRHQPLWVRLFNRIRIYPYTFSYSRDQGDGRVSKYTTTITKSKWFYMQLKNWSETNDRDAAVAAMRHLDWEQDIP